MLTIEGVPTATFIKEASTWATNGPGRYDLDDPIQQELRHIKDWITMAEHDALTSNAHPARVVPHD